MALRTEITKRHILFAVIILILGVFIGRGIFGGSNGTDSTHEHSEAKGSIWTCSMHPQIQQDKPGQCPICGMDLIPLNNSMDSESSLPDEVPMSASAMKLAEVQTLVIKREKPIKELRLLGRVKPDERLKLSQVVHFPGRIEKLYVNVTGEKVAKGQKIASIYSPELVTAQKELFEVLKNEQTDPELLSAARNKLRLWKFTDEQIADLERTKKIQTAFDVLSDHSGYVMELNVAKGDYVEQGQKLFHLVDLSNVWVLLEAYEDDLPWVKIGDKVEIEVRSVPRKKFSGTITFIDPFVDPKTRVAYVRVELPNPNTLLKPDMFADGVITSKLRTTTPELMVPKSAVLWTGKRAVVYVKLPDREHNTFIYREVLLGEDAGDHYVVKNGIEEGEEIAVNGVFKIDAAAQLSGKKSMMNPTGGRVATGHHHGASQETNKREMRGMDDGTKIDKSSVPGHFQQQLGAAVLPYLKIKDELVQDQVLKESELNALLSALENVDMNLVLGDAHNLWMNTFNRMKTDLIKLNGTQNLSDQRLIFSSLSTSFTEAISKLGVISPSGQALYLEHCPMVNENAGAYWLSFEKEIRNPYFGSKMLKCGSVIDTIEMQQLN